MEIFQAEITARWSDLTDIGITGYLKGDKIEVWEYGKYMSKTHGACSKMGLKFDAIKFEYISITKQTK